MNRNIRILAGTALATVMASASAGAFPARNPVPTGFEPAILLAQSDESVEELRPRGGGSEEAEPRERRKQRAERQAEPEGRQDQEQPRRREASEDEAERPRQKRAREAERQADEEQAEPRRKAREARQAEEQPAAAEQERPRRKSREAQAEEPPEAGEAERQAEQERPRKKSREARQAEEQQEPQAEEPARRKPRQAEQDAQPSEADRQRAGSAEESDPQAEEQRPRDRRKAREAAQDAERQRAEEQQREEAAPEEARPTERQRRDGEQRREAGDEPARAETPEDGDRPTERAEPQGPTPRERTAREEAPDDGSAAPVLDSQKQRPREERDRDQARERDRDREQAGDSERPRTGEDQARERREEPRTDEPPAAEVPAGPPPDSDRAAQESVRRAEIRPVIAEEGRRREGRPDDDRWRRRERPEGTDVLREIGDRLILGFGDQVIVESNDRPRMARGAREVYYEDLPRGRTREVIVRADGTRVVTIRNAYGDVIRRSRIAPDDREYILAYVEEDDYDRVRDWRDPGLDLPPLRLDIPEEEYILDAAAVEEPDVYYEFLEQPPVERVERLYSVDEVKRSARIRDKTRRIDLDTLTFEFGSASIPEDQIPRLEGVAQAIEKLLEKNPAETILIEGHTDAVGSDLANLALSDRRAEAVAEALTNVFAIPPENLSTQGYGEEFLKVRTQAPERENRRVAIRRITPLVAPVASAQ
jgi:outer membrane protein OmpA-like peptidoglycan-associated protein